MTTIGFHHGIPSLVASGGTRRKLHPILQHPKITVNMQVAMALKKWRIQVVQELMELEMLRLQRQPIIKYMALLLNMQMPVTGVVTLISLMVFRLTVMIRLLFRARNITANGMKITIKGPSTQLNFSQEQMTEDQLLREQM